MVHAGDGAGRHHGARPLCGVSVHGTQDAHLVHLRVPMRGLLGAMPEMQCNMVMAGAVVLAEVVAGLRALVCAVVNNR